MINEKLELIINEYFDGELEKSKEPFLFTALSEDEDAREYFKGLHLMKETVNELKTEFPESLDEKILLSISEKTEKKGLFSFGFSNSMNALSYAFAMILLILSIFLYSRSLSYQKNIEFADKRIHQQNQMINTLFNSLPPTEVNSAPGEQIIIKTTL